MPDTPPAVRGQGYNTHLFQRCYNFHQCRMHLTCTNFNPYDSMCVECESYKPLGMRTCRDRQCSDDRQTAIVLLERRFGRPLHDQNDEGKTVEVMESSFNQNNQLIVKEF